MNVLRLAKWSTSLCKVKQTKCFSTLLSKRKQAELETQVLDQLKQVHDPMLQQDLVTLARIQNLQINSDGTVHFDIMTPSPVLPQLKDWQHQSVKAVEALDWVKSAVAGVKTMAPRNATARAGSSLAKVANIIAVSSCKGGVGKSTVAVNLACSLKQQGARVGILDADIYGPSLPTMISPKDAGVRPSKTTRHFVDPVEYEGIKCMSFGFVNTKAAPGAGGKGAAIMRGPMVSKIVDQLVLGTDWGELDYLVLDLPPGTGDIQMSLSQQVSISGAVIVTTPQKLSFVDVEKGLEMFEGLKVPVVAIVENMSYFDCIHGTRHYPFGRGHLEQLSKATNTSNLLTLPILEDFSSYGDAGRPTVLQDDANPQVVDAYKQLGAMVAQDLVKARYEAQAAPSLVYHAARGGLVIRSFDPKGAYEQVLDPKALRLSCRCAACVDEFTGKQLIDPASIPDDIAPKKIQQKGNYAYAVTWTDGHSSSLYTFDQLNALARVV